MVSKKVLLMFLTVIQISRAVIYRLNDTQYDKMPPVFYVDKYSKCMRDPQALYCDTKMVLVSDDPDNSLLNIIQEFSAHTKTHYNHTLLRYIVCVTTTCKEFINNTMEPSESIEACFNKTLQEHYGLKVKLKDCHCRMASHRTEVDTADIAMFVVIIVIVTLNIVGSVYDIYWTNGEKEEGIHLLMCFAIRRNWRKLVAPALEGPDPRMKRLKILSFLKTGTLVLVMAVHATTPSSFYIDNPKYFEDLLSSLSIQIVANGGMAVQTFFVVSGFLLTYNLQRMSEKDNFKVNWFLLPKGYLLRWIRLTPVCAFVLFFTVTCSKHLSYSGPYWHSVMMREVEDCKKYWWQHLLYINNYYDNSRCNVHTWYLAADTQLFTLSLAVYILCKTPLSRKVVLSLLLMVAILIPVLHTYFQDLDGAVAVSPEDMLSGYISNAAFNTLHKRGHTNIVSYVVGVAVGYMTYHGQKVNYNVDKLKKYCILYYALIPLATLVIMSGSALYGDAPRPQLWLRLLYAAYMKPVWCFIMGAVILGCVFKYEDFFRPLSEWHGFTILSRLTYCAFLVHIIIIRLLLGLHDSISTCSVLSAMERMSCAVVLSYAAACACWLLLERPLARATAAPRRATGDAHTTNRKKTVAVAEVAV